MRGKAKLYLLGRLRRTAAANMYEKDINSQTIKNPRLLAEKLFEASKPQFHMLSYVCSQLNKKHLEKDSRWKKD